MASAVEQRRHARWPVVFGLILYCAACWTMVVVMAENLYQFAAPHEASAQAEGVVGPNRTAR